MDPIETEGRVGFAAGVGKPVQWLIDVHEAESIIQHGIQMAVDFGEVLSTAETDRAHHNRRSGAILCIHVPSSM